LKDLFGKDFQIITPHAVTVNEIEYSNVLKSFGGRVIITFSRAINSAGECHLHTVEVAGSIPASPILLNANFAGSSSHAVPLFSVSAALPNLFWRAN